ncbi:hypothetical protein DMI62_13780 [Escherichia coli]|nr:hypothetical protein [Escherichia coli]
MQPLRADVTFRDVKTYTGFWGNGATTKVVFRIDVLTPEGVYYGEYAQDGYTLWLGNILTRFGRDRDQHQR